MARAFTAAERTNIGATAKKIYARFYLMDSEGNWDDMSALGSNDWFLGASLEKGLEDNCWRMTARFRLDNGSTASLAPLREDSTLNLNSLAAYAPQVDAHRQWKVEVAVIEATDTLQSSDWKELCAGLYQKVVITDNPRILTIYGMDYGASLALSYIDTVRTYGAGEIGDPNGVAMETVIQQVLDDNGLSGITLYTPVSPSFLMNKFELKDLSVMQAVNLIAAKAGYKVYYEYDASDVFRLTLKKPNRTAVPGDEVWTLGPGEYYEVPSATIDGDQIRNEIVGRYWDSTSGKVEPITRQNTTSIARYGGPHAIPYRMALDLSKDTNLTSSTRVTTFLDAVLSDVATPPFEHEYVTPGFWIAQHGDYGKFTANGVHYSTTQYGGVNWIRHDIANGTIKTHLRVGGQPAGRYRTWLADPNLIRGVPELRIKNFRETDRSTTEVTYGWEVEGLAHQLWLWLDTAAQPISAEPWQSLDSLPDVRLTNTTTSYTVEIPATGYTTYGQLVPVDANGVMGNPWQFTLQGELIRLIQQASVIAQSATQTTVRVRVANPLAGGNITVTAAATGCTIDTSSQTILSGVVTSSLDTTGYVDFVITRPAFQAGTGRVVFTATATDRIADVDAVDVPAQERDTVALLASGVAQSSGATTVVYRVAVADPATGGSGDVSIAWVQTGTGGVAPASPQTIASASVTTSLGTTGYVDFTVTRPAVAAASGIVTFTCSRTGRAAAVLSVSIPAEERDFSVDQIATTEIENLAITAAKIGASAVEEAKVAAGAITEAKLGAAAVTTAKLANLAVTDAILAAGAVTTTKITDTAVTSAKIAANTIVAGNIAAGTITTNEIAANTITAGDIAAGTITGTEIAAATITGAKLVANTITASQIAAGTITATEIAAGAITTAKLDALAVTTDKIAANAITAAKIAANTITAAEIAANAITSDEINAGAVTAAKISVTSLSAIVAEVGSLVVTDGTSSVTFKLSTTTLATLNAYALSAGPTPSFTYQGIVATVHKPSAPATTATLNWYYQTHSTLGDYAILTVGGRISADSHVSVGGDLTVASNVGFYGTAATSKQTVTGSRANTEAGLANLLTALATIGLINDSTTA